MSGALQPIAALVLTLGLAPLLPGIATRARAILTGRRGAPATQLYRDLWRLARKGAVYSNTTTWIFRAAPAVLLATALTATVLLPLGGRSALLSFAGDAVAFVYLFGLGRFAIVLAALDTGSSFEGMGASREVTFASFVEPGLLLGLAALSLATGDLSLAGMLGPALVNSGTIAPALVMVGASFFVLLLAECSRVPVDDPATHLELTMIHEVMVLDHSGPDLGYILYANALRLALFGSLVVGVLVPRATMRPEWALAALVAGLIGVAMAIGIVESFMARLRLPRVPLFVAGGAALAGFGTVLLLR